MNIYLIFIAVIGLVTAYAGFVRKENKDLKSELEDRREYIKELSDMVMKRNETIIKLQEAYTNEADKKKKLNTGSDTDKFNSSLDILSNKTGKN